MKVLKEFPKKSHANGAYEPFLDGKVYELTVNDFAERKDLGSLRTVIQGAGRHRGIKVKTAIIGDKLFVQAVNK